MEQGRDLSGLEKHLADAVKNINSDRAVTNSLLADVVILLKKERNEPQGDGYYCGKVCGNPTKVK